VAPRPGHAAELIGERADIVPAMRTALATAAAAALLLVTATSASAAPARDGYWRTSAGGSLVELRVAGHRVVAVSAEIETTSVGSPDETCGTMAFSFLGPFSPRTSSAKGFAVEAGARGWEVKGTFASATKLTGTAQVHASSRNPCAGKTKFTAAFEGAN
jgi:hypothetical protein